MWWNQVFNWSMLQMAIILPKTVPIAKTLTICTQGAKILWKFGQNPLRNVGVAHTRYYLHMLDDISQTRKQNFPSEISINKDWTCAHRDISFYPSIFKVFSCFLYKMYIHINSMMQCFDVNPLTFITTPFFVSNDNLAYFYNNVSLRL